MCFGFLKKKRSTRQEPKVCIPDHAKPRLEKEKNEKIAQERRIEKEKLENDFIVKRKIQGATNLFKITGRYDSANEIMLSGTVESGSIREKMKTNINGNEIKITEIRIGSQKVHELNIMEEGTIFVKGKSIQNIKYDDLLDFKP